MDEEDSIVAGGVVIVRGAVVKIVREVGLIVGDRDGESPVATSSTIKYHYSQFAKQPMDCKAL